jgi:hypothetical protein
VTLPDRIIAEKFPNRDPSGFASTPQLGEPILNVADLFLEFAMLASRLGYTACIRCGVLPQAKLRK